MKPPKAVSDYMAKLGSKEAQQARLFRELMAVMHGDGGNYLNKVGNVQAFEDAQSKYYELLGRSGS